IEGSLDQAAGVEGSVAQLPFGLKAGGIVREGNNGGVGSFAGLVEHRLGTDEEPTDRVIGLFDTHVDVRDRLAGAKSKDDGIVFRKKRRAVLMDGGGLPVGGSATEEKARGNAEGTFRASVTSDDGAVGLLNDDSFGHGGDDGAVAFFTLAEGQLIQTAFNGDAGELDAEIDEVLFGGNGSAGLAGVDGEGAEDVSLMRKNGRGPAGAKIMTFDQFAEVFPERIFEDVCNDDTLFAVHGSAAGAGAGPDGEAVNGADVGFGEAGSGAVAEVPAVLIQKEEGTKETGELQLDQAHESRESAVEGGTGGDHLEEPGLDGEQAFGAFAMGEVADDFGGTHDVTGVILDGGNRERDVEKTAVLMLAERFEMFDAFTAREALADGDFLGLEAWGKEDGDGAADDFLGAIAEEAFGAGIPGLDDAVEVTPNDGVFGGNHDGGEERLVLSAFEFGAGVTESDVAATHGLCKKTDGSAHKDEDEEGDEFAAALKRRSLRHKKESHGGGCREQGGKKARAETGQDRDEHDGGIKGDVGRSDIPKPAQCVTDGSGGGDGENGQGVSEGAGAHSVGGKTEWGERGMGEVHGIAPTGTLEEARRI